MPAARTIVFAPEGGANPGHLGRDLALAQAFRPNDNQVVLAVPDVRATVSFMGQEGWTIMQAPLLRPIAYIKPLSINFAGMLPIRFYAHPLMLAFLLIKARFVVTSGVCMLTTSLLAVVPVLFLSQTVEQHIVGQAAVGTGAVSVVNGDFTFAGMTMASAGMVHAADRRDRAMAFTTHYLSINFENNAIDAVSMLPAGGAQQ